MYRKSRNNRKDKKDKNTRTKREKLQLLAKCTITRTPKQYKKVSKILDVIIQSHQKRPNECVFVKGKVLVHNNNVSNNNMITEIKDNRIINIKNKTINNI